MNTVPSVATTGKPPVEGRIDSIEVCRGIAAVCVVTHHMLGMTVRTLAPGSVWHSITTVASETIHFSVPTFIFISALVLTRAGLKRFSPTQYYRGRVKRIVVPYLVWTVLYALFRVWTTEDQMSVLLDWKKWLFWIQYGKAYFHLYFLVLILQFHLVLPFLWPFFRKLRLWEVVFAAIWLQLVIYLMNRSFIHFRFPGSIALWYIPVFSLGVYCGIHLEELRTFLVRRRNLLCLAAVAAWATYIPLAYGLRITGKVNTFHYALALWLYTTVAAVCMFAFAENCAARWRSLDAIRALGSKSLQIYILHPAILVGLAKIGFPDLDILAIVVCIFYIGITVFLSWGFAQLLSKNMISSYIFGRN